MSKTKTINWLVYGELPTGIINSQIIDLADLVSNKTNFHGRIWVLSPMSAFRKFKMAYSKIDSPVKITLLPMLPFQGRHTLWQLNFLLLSLFSINPIKKQVWIARGPKAGSMVRFMKKLKPTISFIYQSRGSIFDESREYASDAVPDIFVPEERENLVSSNRVFAVSHQLVNRHEEVYDIKIKSKSIVCPTIIDSRRIPVERSNVNIASPTAELGIVNLAYLSGGQGWQSDKTLIDFLTILNENHSSLQLRYFGNPPQSTIRRQLNAMCNVEYGRVPSSLVIQELSNSDFGLLLREESQTNVVATPTKFAEYCAAGLIPIVSGVPFYLELLQQFEVPHLVFDCKKKCVSEHFIDRNNLRDERGKVVAFAKAHLTENSSFFRSLTSALR